MRYFETFLKDNLSATILPESLVATSEAAIAVLPSSGPDFDTFGLSPLGVTVSNELARAIAHSDKPFDDFDASANPYVPAWVDRGNKYFAGDHPEDFYGKVYDPYVEPEYPGMRDATIIAKNCLQLAAVAVKDANFLARSILAKIEYEDIDRVAVLRNSTAFISRVAMQNDSTYDHPTRRIFEHAVGAVNEPEDTIAPDNLVFDEVRRTVDLSDDAKRLALQCSMPDGGCPALRIRVPYQGIMTPMIFAFWSASVDVISTRI